MSYFDSIDDFVLARWWKCTDGDLRYTRVNINEGSEANDWEAWCKIHDSYLNEFGISGEAKVVFELRKRIALLQCDLVIENNDFLRNEVRRLTAELLDILNRTSIDGAELTRDGLVIHLEKWIGFRLNEDEMTTRKFYSIVREYEREVIAMKKAQS